MQSRIWVYFQKGTVYRHPVSVVIPEGTDIGEAFRDAVKIYPWARKIVLSYYPDPYKDWDMQGEKLKWFVAYDVNASGLAAWYCL